MLLLGELCSNFEVVPATVDELEGDGAESPEAVALENARRKARAVSLLRPDALVLGADTIVVLGCRVFGKPRDFLEADAMLAELTGKEHRVVTAVCLVRRSRSMELDFCETTHVLFRELNEEQRRSYLRRIDPLDKAGGYSAQEDRGELIVSVRGSLSNVIGLPVETLRTHLDRFA